MYREWGGAALTGTKKFRMALILGVCAAIGIAVFSKLYAGRTLPEHDPGTAEMEEHAAEQVEPDAETTEFVIGEEVLLTAIEEALDGKLNVSGLSVEIQDNAVVALSGTVSKNDAAALLETQDDSISSAYIAILDLLPDSLPLELEARLYADSGAAAVSLKSLKVSSMEIPDTVIGEDQLALLGENLNRSLSGTFQKIESISSADGKLTVTGIRA